MTSKFSHIQKNLWKGPGKLKESSSISTGYSQLDQYLPGGGWPIGALTEILLVNTEQPPIWLIVPALAKLEYEKRWQAWIAPTGIPYAPAIANTGIDISKTLVISPPTHKDILWATEQTLESGVCSAVLFWPHKMLTTTSHRLQIAAKNGHSFGLCFCSSKNTKHNTMATLRILFNPDYQGGEITILKSRGIKPTRKIKLVRKY